MGGKNESLSHLKRTYLSYLKCNFAVLMPLFITLFWQWWQLHDGSSTNTILFEKCSHFRSFLRWFHVDPVENHCRKPTNKLFTGSTPTVYLMQYEISKVYNKKIIMCVWVDKPHRFRRKKIYIWFFHKNQKRAFTGNYYRTSYLSSIFRLTGLKFTHFL